ncbi:MucBP domain-containing protein [Lactococcus formosensis]|uniref:MucBP domain-containing protein n=1 Tax=Lactococcus formosensis TaxID=1281486 RepID=UPI001BCA885E|nr:MucBP domain-containing protein [Lactococcus formosensis]
MKMELKQWLRKRKISFTILSVLTVLGLLITLSSLVIPKIMAGDTVVSDLVLQAETEDKSIALTVTDSNQEDTKIVVPLPEGVTYQSNSNSSIGVTQDTVNNQLVIDWVEGQEKQVTLQLEAKEEGSYDFTARTVREGEPVTSSPCSVTVKVTPPSSSEAPHVSTEEEDQQTSSPENENEESQEESGTEDNNDTPELSGTEDDIKNLDTDVSETTSVERNKVLASKSYNFSYTLSPENNEGTEFSIQNIILDDNSEGYGSLSIGIPNGMSSNINEAMMPEGWELNLNSSGYSIIINPGASTTAVKNFLSTLRFMTNTEYKAPGAVSITVEQNKISNWVDPSGKHHYYLFVPYLQDEIVTFQKSYNQAKQTTYKGLTGYLATITSQEEQDFIYNSIAKEPGYLGGTHYVFSNGNRINDEQVISENTLFEHENVDYKQGEQWYWLDGPEAGTVFYNTKTYDPIKGPVPGVYNHFKSEEPNNTNGQEGVLQFANLNDLWNDMHDYYQPPRPFNSVQGYYVEFSEYGDQTEESSQNTYTANIPQAVTTKYIDTYNNKISEDVHSSGPMGQSYTIEQKDIPGYTFKKVEGPTTGKFTDQPQAVTYTYTSDVLRFYDVPSELSFNETKISSHTETISRKDPNWKIIVEDTRLSKRNWRVTAQLVDQFKDSSGQPLKDDILLFRKGNQSDQWITSSSEMNVFDGTSTETDDLYDVLWPTQEGLLLQVAPGTVKVGKYTGVINWKLIDAPV